MTLKTQKYKDQVVNWPKDGKHILAQYDDNRVVVYQAYRPAIGKFAAEKQFFGGEFSYSRMSWIKPNFLWMMYRCGWASKPGQEVVLAIHLKRTFFDDILKSAFPSSNKDGLNKEEWNSRISTSNVRLQWDPDHNPFGKKEERRAIQLGLRNNFLTPFKGEAILEIEDISDFVQEQKQYVYSGNLDQLETPVEEVYPVSKEIRKILCM